MSKSALHKAGYFTVQTILALLILAVAAGSVVQAARPQVALRTTLVYPRSDLDTSEALVWRGQLTVRHQVSSRLSWNLLGDVTAATFTRPAGLRIYAGQLRVRLGRAWQVSLGRHIQWNSLQTTRFDGVTLDRRQSSSGSRRQLTIYVGVSPRTEYRTDYGDAGTVVAGGIVQRTSGLARYSVQVWANQMGGTGRVYLGGSLRRRIAARITQVADLAVNVLQPAVDKIRLRTQVRLSRGVGAFIQYRYAGQLTVSPYPWHDEPLDPRQAISTGAQVSLLKNMWLRLSLVQRLGDNRGRYLRAQLAWGGLQLTWQSQAQTIYRGQYLRLSGQRTLLGKIRVGGSLGTGAYTLFDEQSPAVAALGATGQERSTLAAAFWVRGTSGRHLGYRLFTQFTRNRYFNRDGRVGLQVSYAL